MKEFYYYHDSFRENLIFDNPRHWVHAVYVAYSGESITIKDRGCVTASIWTSLFRIVSRGVRDPIAINVKRHNPIDSELDKAYEALIMSR